MSTTQELGKYTLFFWLSLDQMHKLNFIDFASDKIIWGNNNGIKSY